MFDATASTDRLVELILEKDKDVLKELLTTDKVVATKGDNVYFGEQRSREEAKAAAAAAGKNQEATAKNGKRANELDQVAEADLSGPKISARVSRRSFGNGSMSSDRILATAPEGQRLGILTHPKLARFAF